MSLRLRVSKAQPPRLGVAIARTPSHLISIGPALVVGRQLTRAFASIGATRAGIGSPSGSSGGSIRWIIQSFPAASPLRRVEQRVAPAHALAVEVTSTLSSST